MPNLPEKTKLYPINKFGLGGLNTFDEQTDIEDIELADVRNMVFGGDGLNVGGVLFPRQGSLLYMAKPSGETQKPLQFLIATDSAGNDFMITVYGNNFYLADTINNQWIKLNQLYTPQSKGIFYGSTNWNEGLGTDALYFGNGTLVDDTMKWQMALTTLLLAVSSGDTYLPVVDSNSFPDLIPVYTSLGTIQYTSPNTITDSSNGFITAGFRAGMTILGVHATLTNYKPLTIVSVTDSTIIVKEKISTETLSTPQLEQLQPILVDKAGVVSVLYYGEDVSNGIPAKNITYTNDTISFTAPHTIGDSANSFPIFKVGEKITVSDSVGNNGVYTVTASTTNAITVAETVVNELAGIFITIVAQTLNFYNGETAGQSFPAGDSVTTPIIDLGAVPKGVIFSITSQKLMISNHVAAESLVSFSNTSDPENFNVVPGLGSGGFFVVTTGRGGILSMVTLGQFFTIIKENLLLQLTFSVDADNNLTINTTSISAGEGVGPVSDSVVLNYMNTLYYPSESQGIISTYPQSTGFQTTIKLDVLSANISNVEASLDWDFGRTCGFDQKLFWVVALPSAGVPTIVNNIVLVYDLIQAGMNPTKSAWTVWDNWNATDIKPVNNVLYYFSANDGGVYQCNPDNVYQDANSNTPIPYTAYALSKRINLDSPATLMRAQYLYIEGYISLNTTFYVNVLFNEGGSLGSQPYKIQGTNRVIVSNAFSGGLGRFVLASPVLGGVDLQTIQNLQQPLFFRCYLELSQAFRPHNIQVQCYSVDMGSLWGVSKMVLMTQPEISIETPLVLSPSSAPPLTLQSL